MAEDTSKENQPSFSANDLDTEDKRRYDFAIKRITALQTKRKSHYGTDIDKLWAEADRDYVPHRLGTKKKKVIATDEEKSWRSSTVTLGSPDWQADLAQANPYIKIQTALSILVDQNPVAVLTASTKKYQATTEIMKQLYQRSWEVAQSKPELKKFVFNLAKYGWAAGRTFPLRIVRKNRVLVGFNPEDPAKSQYEEREVVEYDDVMRENLDPRNTWIDDMAKPNSTRSVNDWFYRKVMDFDDFKEEYANYERTKMVLPGGNTQEVVSIQEKAGTQSKDEDSKKLVELYFYENKAKDLYMVAAGANKVPIILDPLPVADQKGRKKLTLWQAYWNLRHAESPYGIGIYEAVRYDQSALDRIRNMSLDQLTLSIYKMFFFQGTQSLTDTGKIKIEPGVGKQVLDPNQIKWLDVPGPGRDAFLGIDMFKKDVDDASGISPSLEGEITGKTAFEIAQAKESALKRLKNPLDNILEALNEDGAITISLMQLMYSVPEVYAIADERLIEDYIREVGGDEQLYSREGEEGNQTFNAKVYREFPLNLDKDEDGNLTETSDTRFFRVKPGGLEWDGFIKVKAQSLLSPSQQVDKALSMEMYNILSPLMAQIAVERQQKIQTGANADLDNLVVGKIAKDIVKLYERDPRDVFPDEWLESTPQPMFVGMGQGEQNPLMQLLQSGQGGAGAGKLVPNTQAPVEPQGISAKMSAAITQPSRSV